LSINGATEIGDTRSFSDGIGLQPTVNWAIFINGVEVLASCREHWVTDRIASNLAYTATRDSLRCLRQRIKGRFTGPRKRLIRRLNASAKIILNRYRVRLSLRRIDLDFGYAATAFLTNSIKPCIAGHIALHG
jgi:hypothetical protein